jgi:hypothetical protein
MTTITLEVPDELAAQLKSLPEPLPDLIQEAVTERLRRRQGSPGAIGGGEPIYQELIEFLTSDPDAKLVVGFKISPVAQERLEDLLDRNRDDALLAEERAELDIYLNLSHLITRMKAKARSGQPPLN